MQQMDGMHVIGTGPRLLGAAKSHPQTNLRKGRRSKTKLTCGRLWQKGPDATAAAAHLPSSLLRPSLPDLTPARVQENRTGRGDQATASETTIAANQCKVSRTERGTQQSAYLHETWTLRPHPSTLWVTELFAVVFTIIVPSFDLHLTRYS